MVSVCPNLANFMFKFLKKLSFHSNGTPRKWLKTLIFNSELVPRKIFRSFVYDGSGDIKPNFHSWLSRALQNPPFSKNNSWTAERNRIIDGNRLGNIRTFGVICTRQTMFVANLIQNQLLALGFQVDVGLTMPKIFNHDLYIVICPQMFERLPPREQRVVFQMEQSISPRWFTEDYLNILYNSLAVFDYSEENIRFLQEKGLPAEFLYHMPLSPIKNYISPEISKSLVNYKNNPTCDVLFYGDVKNKRRKKFLKILQSYFDVRIETNLFGEELWRALASSRVVVNIHYYENALLESTRICECLSLGARLVSEAARDQARYVDWEDLVVFTPVDDVQAMVRAIQRLLKNPNPIEYSLENYCLKLPMALSEALRSLHILTNDTESNWR